MRFSFLAASLTGLLFSSMSSAAEDTETTGPPPAEEMIVFGDLEVSRRRGEVLQNLKALGYREKKRRNGRSLLVHNIPYRPNVLVDDDGYIVIRRAPVRIDPAGEKDNKLRYLWCVPPFTFTAACIRTGGQVVSPRKLQRYKHDVARATAYEVRQWREAIIDRAMEKRLGEEIPDLLTDIWERGLPGEMGEALLLDPASKRAAILKLWSSRACNKAGQQVRELVADFVRYEIQNSEFPPSTAELRAANARNNCGDKLVEKPPIQAVDGEPAPN
jgi:hypothetical protein